MASRVLVLRVSSVGASSPGAGGVIVVDYVQIDDTNNATANTGSVLINYLDSPTYIRDKLVDNIRGNLGDQSLDVVFVDLFNES